MMTNTTRDTRPLTAAEHRAMAEADIARMRHNGDPGDSRYHGLALSALAHVLSAMVSYLEPPPAPGIPGLPDGWEIQVRRSVTGRRLWGFLVTDPAGREWPPPRSQWGEPENALAAGIRYARERAMTVNGGL